MEMEWLLGRPIEREATDVGCGGNSCSVSDSERCAVLSDHIFVSQG